MKLKEGVGQNQDTIQMLLEEGFEDNSIWDDSDPFCVEKYIGPAKTLVIRGSFQGPIVSRPGDDEYAAVTIRSYVIDILLHRLFSTAEGGRTLGIDEFRLIRL